LKAVQRTKSRRDQTAEANRLIQIQKSHTKAGRPIQKATDHQTKPFPKAPEANPSEKNHLEAAKAAVKEDRLAEGLSAATEKETTTGDRNPDHLKEGLMVTEAVIQKEEQIRGLLRGGLMATEAVIQKEEQIRGLLKGGLITATETAMLAVAQEGPAPAREAVQEEIPGDLRTEGPSREEISKGSLLTKTGKDHPTGMKQAVLLIRSPIELTATGPRVNALTAVAAPAEHLPAQQTTGGRKEGTRTEAAALKSVENVQL